MLEDIWIIAQTRENVLEKPTFGLIGEARRLLADAGKKGRITVVTMDIEQDGELEVLAEYGADRVLSVRHGEAACCQAELQAEVLLDLCEKHRPSCLLLCQTPENIDLGPRLAALLKTTYIGGAVDLRTDDGDTAHGIRMIANGYLFEELRFSCEPMPVISFQPFVLTPPAQASAAKIEIIDETVHIDPARLKTRSVQIITASPDNLGLEEAEIIVLGGRGVGKGEEFSIIHQLAESIGGTVGGSRPVIDMGILPFERQIGQTGKSVTPRLLIACAVSGANELTVGFEEAGTVVAINTDQRARIFRFADLGIVGDVQEVLPLLVAGLQNQKEKKSLPC